MTSNSDSSTLKKDQKQNESEVSSKPNSDLPNAFRITDSIEPELDREEAEEAESTDSSGSSNLKNQSIFWAIEVSENEDGFKTPTSLEHKIPPVTECPPAPKNLENQEREKLRHLRGFVGACELIAQKRLNRCFLRHFKKIKAARSRGLGVENQSKFCLFRIVSWRILQQIFSIRELTTGQTSSG